MTSRQPARAARLPSTRGEEPERLAVVGDDVAGVRAPGLAVLDEVVVAERGVRRPASSRSPPGRRRPRARRQLHALVHRARGVAEDGVAQVGVELARVDQLVAEVHAEEVHGGGGARSRARRAPTSQSFTRSGLMSGSS